MAKVRTFTPDWSVAPGEILFEVMDERNISIRMARALLRMSEPEVMALLKGEALLTDEIAARLEMAFGVPAVIWRNLEGRWRQELTGSHPAGEQREAGMSDLDALVNAIVSEAHKWKNYDTSTTEGFRNRLRALLAAERARAERAEAERDAAVKARLDWQADYDREKRQLHAMIDDARQRAEAAEGREARLRPVWDAVERMQVVRASMYGLVDTVLDDDSAVEAVGNAMESANRALFSAALDVLDVYRAALAGTLSDLPATTPRESYPATIIVTEVRGGPAVCFDEIAPRDVRPEGE